MSLQGGKIIVLIFVSLSSSINEKLDFTPLSLYFWEFNYYDSNTGGINEKRKNVKDRAKRDGKTTGKVSSTF